MAKMMLSNLAAIAQNTQNENIRMIEIDELHDSPSNFFRMDHIDELADAILGQGGVKDNLVVTPLDSGGYMIVSGHCRKAAVRLLLERGDQISRLLPCLVQHYETEDDLDLDLILLNVTARQLNDNEIWQSYQRLDQYLKRKKADGVKFGSMREELARQLNLSRSQVSKLQHISSSAEPAIQEAVADGTISINTANEIAKLEPEQQQTFAEGDLRSVTPKKIRDDAAEAALAAPKDLRWDGETLYETMKYQLMRLISEPLHEAAINTNSVDFVNEFRRKCRTVYLSDDEGISVECGYDRITVSFSNPADYKDIRSIWLAWRTAGKYVQTCETIYYDDTCCREYREQIGYPLLHDGITPHEHEELNEPLSSLYWEAHQELSGLHIDVVLSDKCGWFLLLYADGIDGAMIENGEIFWQ